MSVGSLIPHCFRCGGTEVISSNLNRLCIFCLQETKGMICQEATCSSPGYDREGLDGIRCRYHWYWQHDVKECEAGTCSHPRGRKMNKPKVPIKQLEPKGQKG